jgi:hypothetical protein
MSVGRFLPKPSQIGAERGILVLARNVTLRASREWPKEDRGSPRGIALLSCISGQRGRIFNKQRCLKGSTRLRQGKWKWPPQQEKTGHSHNHESRESRTTAGLQLP